MPKHIPLDPATLLGAYTQGVFPMGEPDGTVRWYTADPRGVLPLERFHVPRTLRQICRQGRFEVRINCDFQTVMRLCMTARPTSWITDELVEAYRELHQLGFAHSVESWREGELVGGLYGVSLGAAFFGESMFHRERDASKVALVALVGRLRERKFELLDTQATTSHLQQFGCIEVSAAEYLRRLNKAISKQRRFD